MSNNNRAVQGSTGNDQNNDLAQMIHRIAPLVGPLVANRLIQALLGLNFGWEATRRAMQAVYDTLRRHYGLIVGSALSTAGLAVLAPSLCVAIVNAIGFTQGGVLAGSIAAAIQSTFYGGATGGLFSALQSFGATAAIASPVVLAIGGTGLAIGVGCLLWSRWKRRGRNDGGVEENDGGEGDNDDDASGNQKQLSSRNVSAFYFPQHSSCSLSMSKGSSPL